MRGVSICAGDGVGRLAARFVVVNATRIGVIQRFSRRAAGAAALVLPA